MSDEPGLSISFTDGHGRVYSLEEIETVSFEGDSLSLVLADRVDSYPFDSITRMEFLADALTGVDGPMGVPGLLEAVHLFQNRPNPFSPSTQIGFDLPQRGWAELRIYDVSGRLVRTLVDEKRPRGRQSVRWDGRDESGRTVPSGVYFYSLIASGVDESRKMILVK
jgi:hypothetical protein